MAYQPPPPGTVGPKEGGKAGLSLGGGAGLAQDGRAGAASSFTDTARRSWKMSETGLPGELRAAV